MWFWCCYLLGWRELYKRKKACEIKYTHNHTHRSEQWREWERERRRIWTEPRKPKNQNKQIDWKYRALFLCKIMLHETVVGFVWAGAVYLLLVLIRSVFGLCRCVVFCFDVFCLARSARVRGKWIFLHLSAYMCGGIHFSWLFFSYSIFCVCSKLRLPLALGFSVVFICPFDQFVTYDCSPSTILDAQNLCVVWMQWSAYLFCIFGTTIFVHVLVFQYFAFIICKPPAVIAVFFSTRCYCCPNKTVRW